MKTLERTDIASVGYEGRTAEELVDLVRSCGITLLVDVRLTPISRKPGLSKRRLAEALSATGVGYLHLPVLGNPRENRDAYRRSESQAHRHFRSLLAEPQASEVLDDLTEHATRESIALLCFERDASTCHRLLVIEALQERNHDLGVRYL